MCNPPCETHKKSLGWPKRSVSDPRLSFLNLEVDSFIPPTLGIRNNLLGLTFAIMIIVSLLFTLI